MVVAVGRSTQLLFSVFILRRDTVTGFPSRLVVFPGDRRSVAPLRVLVEIKSDDLLVAFLLDFILFDVVRVFLDGPIFLVNPVGRIDESTDGRGDVNSVAVHVHRVVVGGHGADTEAERSAFF